MLRAQGAEELEEEGAAAVAGLAAMARGQGEPGTSAAECRVVTPGFMADLHGVRNVRKENHKIRESEKWLAEWNTPTAGSARQDAAVLSPGVRISNLSGLSASWME